MKSMTGYGKSEIKGEEYHILFTLKSVNKRFLQINYDIPSEINHLEKQLDDIIKGKIKRGYIMIKIDLESKLVPKLMVNENKFKEYWDKVEKLKSLTKEKLNIDLIEMIDKFELINEIEPQIPNEIEQHILFACRDALDNHQKMAIEEGKSMRESLIKSKINITNSLSNIVENFPNYKEKKYKDLKLNIEKLLQDKMEEGDYRRIMLEAAMYIDKADVNEEIIRLKSHLDKLSDVLKIEHKSIGKKLNFILQEMHREINTISSKYRSEDIFSDILIIKEEIEKSREIVQNVE